MPEKLAYKFGDTDLQARRIELAEMEDVHELMFERGWSDGLPLVPPTEDRVLRMLAGNKPRAGRDSGSDPAGSSTLHCGESGHQRSDGGL